MNNDRPFRADDLIRSVGELPDLDPELKKRVMRAARKAEHRRLVRRRVQWALSGSAAAIILAAIFGVVTTPNHSETKYAPGTLGRSTPSVLPAVKPEPVKEQMHEPAAEKRATRTQRFR